VPERDVERPEGLVLLHGFAGTHRSWDRVIDCLDPQRYRPLALDLPGHGAAATHRSPIDFAACVEQVLAASPQRFALCGYSMGGRIALHVALAAPERVTRLALVATSAGIDDAAARSTRRSSDRRLADWLERAPFEDFIERWNAQPLFAEDPQSVAELARADQRRNHPAALAAALRGLGTGEMRPLRGRLEQLELSVSVLAGSRDAKFIELGRRLAAAIRHSTFELVPGGHRLPLESPRLLAHALNAASRQ